MTDREKLIKLLECCVEENVETDDGFVGVWVMYGNIADHLIANGVTFAKDTNVLTNEDRICGARGRELAQILYSIEGADYCKELPECWRMLEETGGIPDDKCIGCLEEWLKKPLEVE